MMNREEMLKACREWPMPELMSNYFGNYNTRDLLNWRAYWYMARARAQLNDEGAERIALCTQSIEWFSERLPAMGVQSREVTAPSWTKP